MPLGTRCLLSLLLNVIKEKFILLVTTIIASILTIIFIKLSLAVISLRRKNKVGLGSGGYEELERAIRAQGNFSEYVPFGIMLLACLELNGAPPWLVTIPGITLIIGRLIHAKGIQTPPPDFSKRVLGMQLTLFSLVGLVSLNFIWLLYKFVF